ncbi:MAG: RNA polymerase sigma factor [Actinomycetota bacterium]
MASDFGAPGLTDTADLVAAAREGDRDAFDEIVRRTYVDTYTMAVRLTACEEDARDVVQEAYLRAWKGIRRFRGEAQFSTWMYRITANTAATLSSKRRRQRTVLLDEVADPVETEVAFHPELATENTELMGRLAAALDELSPRLRTLVVLKDIYGLSHEDIAAELGISVTAAKVRLHRGRKRLQDLLHEEDVHRADAV